MKRLTMNKCAGALAACAVAAAAAVVIARQFRRPNSFAGRVVLITGGSRGLGLEMARLFAAEGARVAICARNDEDLTRAVVELQSLTDAIRLVCDVTSQEQVDEAVAHVVERWGAIDVLVNNAGIIQVGPLDSMTLDDYRNAFDKHLWGPLYMIQAVLPHMRRQGGGRIVNISSIGGKISVPHLLPYCASKFALVGLSEGLRAELAADNVSVTTVFPGLMRTGSPRNALFKGQHRAEYAWFSISDSLPGITISSRRAARQVLAACRHGRAHLAISLPCKVAIRVHGVFPGLTADVLALVNRSLPSATPGGTESKSGEESFSNWSPSALTWLNERAAAANNEVR